MFPSRFLWRLGTPWLMAPMNFQVGSLALAGFLSLSAAPVFGQLLHDSYETTLFVLAPDGPLYTTHADGGPFSLVASTGEPMSSMTQHRETLLLGAQSGNVYRYDMNSGALTLDFFLNSDLRAMAVQGDELYAGGSNSLLFRVDANSGAVMEINAPGFAIEALAPDGDLLYAGSPNGDIFVDSTLGGPGFDAFTSTRSGLDSLGQSHDLLYVGGASGIVRVFEKATEGLIYAYPLSSDAVSMVRDADNFLVADSGGTIQRVVAQVGSVLATTQAPTQIQDLWLPQPLGRLTPATSFQQIQSGISLEFTLETSPDQAGNFHFLLGSFGGNTPGLIVQNHQFPLNMDVYLQACLENCLGGALNGCFGILDGEGNSTVSFNLATALPPALVGLELRHAFFILDQADPGAIVGVSQAADMYFQ